MFASRHGEASSVVSSVRLAVTLAMAALGAFVAMPSTSAHAGGFRDTSCVGTWRSFNCAERWGPAVDPYVRLVPQPMDEAEKARITARDRRWLARCRPLIAYDRYGVPRYHYAAPGCEFGVGED